MLLTLPHIQAKGREDEHISTRNHFSNIHLSPHLIFSSYGSFSKSPERNHEILWNFFQPNRPFRLRFVFPFQTTCHSLENMILCLRCIHIHVSSRVKPLNKEIILQGMTHDLKWENIVTQPKRSIASRMKTNYHCIPVLD